MKQEMHESLGERIVTGIFAAVIAGVGAVVVEALDFWFWDMGWVEAKTFSEYIQKVWFIPVGFAIIAFFMGLWKGSAALDFAKNILTRGW